MLAVDAFTGTAAVIAAFFAGLAWVIAAWNHKSTNDVKNEIDTGPDNPPIGQIIADLAGSPPPPPPLPEMPEPRHPRSA